MTARGRDEIVELVRDGLRRTLDPTMLNASIAMLPMLTRTDAIARQRAGRAPGSGARPTRPSGGSTRAPTFPNVRDQAELWAGHAHTELEWAKGLSKRLAEGAYTMADDRVRGGAVP